MDSNNGYGPAPERGARRRKLAGYLKAANELRQSYQQAYGLGGQKDAADDDEPTIPGAFPDVSVVRNGDEEMVLFPSYARRHHRRKSRRHDTPGGSQDIRSEQGAGDAEYWKKKWEVYEEENSVVDVDVRGWIYSPHKGQMTRKNRLLVGIARQLSGIPAPSSSRASSPQPQYQVAAEGRNARYEEEQVAKEAESIARKGQSEADIAWQGGYSESPSRDTGHSPLYSSPDQSRTSSPDRRESHGSRLSRPASNSSFRTAQNDRDIKPLSKRASWTQPSEMTATELAIANSHLMARLKPFLTTPLVNTSLTVFFYNDEVSRSRTIYTNESGHFNLRAPLDFIPTHVRVLASDKLSATEVVRITEPNGISIISDIDDTIKHSGIGNGAREIFRNAFIRDVADLTIDGVKEWYITMANLGVTFHYVSNSPWQLYPVLTSFFACAGLPKGSFHLKQYTGMLQGIFEPVAERKKGTLDRILADFPERHFILVGDSGEADLELYTDIMVANPGRILGVFIRDVTTTRSPSFFDSAIGPRGSRSPLRGRSRDNKSISPIRHSTKPEEKPPPPLPPRQQSRSASTFSREDNGPIMGTLIDFDDEPIPGVHRSLTDPEALEAERKLSTISIKSLPPRPSKPQALRSLSGDHTSSSPPPISSIRKPAPPPPPKPRQYSNAQEQLNLPSEPSPLSQTQNASPPGSRATSLERQSYRAAVRNKVASAYNALPSLYTSSSPTSQPQPPTSDPSKPTTTRQPPPVPPRRNISSYPAAAAQYASNRLSNGWSGGHNNDGNSSSDDATGNEPVLSKKEEIWLRRWQRAKDIFEEKGVVLRSWRTGEDVADEAVRLVERAKKEQERRRERW